MHAKFLIFLGMTIGSIIGGYLPALFGVDLFSFTAVVTSGIGGILGIIIGYKISNSI